MILQDPKTLLVAKNIKTYYFTLEGVVRAVDGVDFFVRQGETLGIAGESGCGKSTICNTILRLVPPPGRIVDGKILLDGEDILSLKEREMPRVRGKKVSMIFQEPMAAIDPVMKLGAQISEVLVSSQKFSKKQAYEETLELLEMIGIDDPRFVANTHGYKLGPGTVQQAMIAMALACRPKVLLADEPTTTMDMDTELHIVDLLSELVQKLKLGMVYITHNLGVIAQVSDRVAVMYAGKIVEVGTTEEVFNHPAHPYTEALLNAFPRHDMALETLPSIPGNVPSLTEIGGGCRFCPRCNYAMAICKSEEPELKEVGMEHVAACFLVGGNHVRR